MSTVVIVTVPQPCPHSNALTSLKGNSWRPWNWIQQSSARSRLCHRMSQCLAPEGWQRRTRKKRNALSILRILRMSGMTSPFLSGFATEWLGGSSGEATSRREGGTLHRAQGLGMWPGILVDGQPDGYHIKFDTYTPTYLPYPYPTYAYPTLSFPSLPYPTIHRYMDAKMHRYIGT